MTNAAAFPLLCEWSVFPSQHRSTCVVALPGKPIRHSWNTIQTASLGADLGENFSHSHMKIPLLTLHRFIFPFNSLELQLFFLIKVKTSSAVHTLFFLKKNNPKTTQTLSLSVHTLLF